MNVSPKVLHLSLLLAMTLPAMAQTNFDRVQSMDNGLSYPSLQEQSVKARNELQNRQMLLSEDKLQTQDRLRIQDKLQTHDPDQLRTRDLDQLRTRDPDQLRTRDPDQLRTRDPDQLRTRDPDNSGNGKNLQQQQKHEMRNMFQYKERASGQGFNSGGSMNRRMNSIGVGSAGGGAGRR